MTRQFKENFAVFILTHGRPDRVTTFNTLRAKGYTGKIYLVIDDEDRTADQYISNFGFENIKLFCKEEIAKKFDTADNFGDKRTIVYARNACFDIAESLGLRYFLEMDDDYCKYDYRFDSSFNYAPKLLTNLDDVFQSILKFFIDSGVDSVAISQGGDFIGGSENTGFADKVKLKRKCMNSFFLSTDRKFRFVGRINEDVNTYTYLASAGLKLFTINQVSLTQKSTQQNKGGMTDIYLDSGTYVKSFYTVIFQPSSVKIRMMGDTNRRLHHKILWKNTVPLVVPEDFKKRS